MKYKVRIINAKDQTVVSTVDFNKQNDAIMFLSNMTIADGKYYKGEFYYMFNVE